MNVYVYDENTEPSAEAASADLVAERLDTGSYWIVKNTRGEEGVMVEADAFDAFVMQSIPD
jgi:hypothetical protein